MLPGTIMRKRAVRITKHLGRTPVEAMCTACQKLFQAPLSTVSTVAGATNSLQEQFDRHQCGNHEDKIQE
jgi:hypothetical protein